MSFRGAGCDLRSSCIPFPTKGTIAQMPRKVQYRVGQPTKLSRSEILKEIDDLVAEVRAKTDAVAELQREIIETGFDGERSLKAQRLFDEAQAALITLAQQVRYRGRV